jgi:hypothetical protein
MISRFSVVLSSLLLGVVTVQCISLLTDSGTSTEIANRFHLRLRTSKFYHRTSAKGRHAIFIPQLPRPALFACRGLDLNGSDI